MNNSHIKKILITGASSGIGQATAVRMANHGVSVVLCGQTPSKLENVYRQLKNPQLHKMIAFDVTDFEKYKNIFEDIISDGQKLDGLVHCAGITEITPLRSMKYETIRHIMDVNHTSFLMLSSYFAKCKFSNENSSIVGVSAVNAHYPQKCMSVYASSKLAIEASVKVMALELIARNIRINCVIPGAVDTPMARTIENEKLEKIESYHLMGMKTADEIANVITFMLSSESSAITGRAIYADGGMLGQMLI